MSEFFSRRDVVKSGGMIALGLVTPGWLSTLAKAELIRSAKGGKPDKDTILVVCQLSGGNDGLNTVVPFANKTYYDVRPDIAIEESKVLKLNDQMGFHPAMVGLAELYKQKRVAIIQNVGYPRPNRSHFASMDIWHSASPELSMRYGWIGRHLDTKMAGGPLNPVYAIGLSTEKPRALTAKQASIPCFASLVDLKSMVGDADSQQLLRKIQGTEVTQGSDASVVQNANRAALDAIQVLNEKLAGYSLKQQYGNDAFGRGFSQVAQLIATSPATRVVYFSAGGFDTHARQDQTHEKLLGDLSNGISAFMKEMEACGKADKVVLVVFSEFGRRVQQNGSGGTDHGHGSVMFLIGKPVKGGFYGDYPDLNNLFQGDLIGKIDFREVYATALDEWMGGDSEVVLGKKFNHINFL